MSGPRRPVLLVLLAITAAASFHELSLRYGGFRLWDGPPAGHAPHPVELTFFFWYLLFGAVVALSVGIALVDRPADAGALEARLRAAAGSPWLLPGSCLVALVGALLVKDLVLAGAPVSDDENIYVFIAKTLALGRVKNPPPAVGADDLGFFQQNFVILEPDGWYGKYPIGHPLLLAIGEVVGLRVLVGPLLAAATTAVTFLVARRLLGPIGAALATVLVAVSPQLVLTAATEHSQNTSQLTMMLGLWLLLRARDRSGAERARELVLAGLSFGLCFLARPLPGGPFVVAAGAWVLFGWHEEPLGARVRQLLAFGCGVAPGVLALAAVNAVQTGHPLRTGYHVAHRGFEVAPVRADASIFVGSVAGALGRQLVWAFGWPVSFLFLPFAGRPSRDGGPSLALVWLLVAAGYSYRLISPKVFVGSTGPIYVAEVVPLLAILTASGMLRLRRLTLAALPRWAPAVGGLALGSTLAAVVMFLPFQLAWLAQLAAPHRFTPDVLVARGVDRAVVFAANVVNEPGASWALFPPPAGPALDDTVLYVRRARSHEVNVAFWKAHFPDRAAFSLEVRGSERSLRPLVPGSERPLSPAATPRPR